HDHAVAHTDVIRDIDRLDQHCLAGGFDALCSFDFVCWAICLLDDRGQQRKVSCTAAHLVTELIQAHASFLTQGFAGLCRRADHRARDGGNRQIALHLCWSHVPTSLWRSGAANDPIVADIPWLAAFEHTPTLPTAAQSLALLECSARRFKA